MYISYRFPYIVVCRNPIVEGDQFGIFVAASFDLTEGIPLFVWKGNPVDNEG